MKKVLTYFLLFCCTCSASAQKKPLDHSVYDSWQDITNAQLTTDGNYLLYEVNPQDGDGTLVVRRINDGKQITVPRGYQAQVAQNCHTACIKIKAPFDKIRQARNKNTSKEDMPKDSLAWINLDQMSILKYELIKSYKTGLDNQNFIAYIQSKAPNKNKKKADKEKLDGNVLVVVNTLTGQKTFLKNVDSYEMNPEASQLAVFVNPDKKNKKVKSSATLYDLPSMTPTLLSEGKKYYGNAKFSWDSKQLAFLASTDTTTTGNKHCSLFYVRNKQADEIIPQDYTKNLLANWSLNENSAPEFSRNGKRILLGVAPYRAPKDTTIIEAETAQLDIWNYKDYQIQPQQKVNLDKALAKVYEAVINLDRPHEIIPLTTAMWDKITIMDEGNGEWALSQDRTRYYIQSQWDDDEYTDIALVNMNNGERKTVATKINTQAQASPDGKYLIWYNMNDSAYYTYQIETGKTINLTRQTGVNFYDEEDDHPNFPPPYDTDPLWTKGDQSVLISDRYDIWKFEPNGNGAVNLTHGKGRETCTQLRHRVYDAHSILEPKYWKEKVAIEEGGKLYMRAFNEQTKRNGFATVNMSDSNSFLVNVLDTFDYHSVYKAQGANVIVYQKGNFKNPYNVYVSNEAFQNEQCLSDVNTQQKEYNWGNVQLVHWEAFDGTPLDGMLFTPEDMDPNKKYPMMIYFYEKNAETLYYYRDPRPSRSIINIPFYVSRGYVVFVPDIVYKVGHPGESAYNCIVAGAKAMCKQFQFVDSTKMAIQGQSWGGYQTAYLVTRTNLFCAAGAGAPVSNMTSAYGGIRWGSGVCRQMQYEHGQSRIGATLWSKGGLDLYLENSPLFKADKVTTPLLIMHNDKDGAVPWYQGIEYFMALRRLGKKVWMLEYNNEEHNLKERRNCKDLSIRLQQFFDHYMKGDAEPAWMKYGVPATRKGEYLGTELTE